MAFKIQEFKILPLFTVYLHYSTGNFESQL